jgi:hypothetical protein
MKKIFLLLTVFSMVFTSCDPLEDIHDEVDALESVISGEENYTLTDDDYTADVEDGGLGFTFTNFNSEDDAKEALPAFLSNKYPVWGKESLVTVTFNLYSPKYDEKSLEVYTVSSQDYTDQGLSYPNFSSFSQITAFLDVKFPAPDNRLLVSLTYAYFSGSVSTLNNGFLYVNGSWEMVQGFSDDEYGEMGESYPNFSSEAEALSKIPLFLIDKFKYDGKSAGDIVATMYKLYVSGSTKSFVANFIFNGTSWGEYNNVIQESIKFGNDGTSWVPDNTIKYTLTQADYDLVDNGYYANFDVRAGKAEEPESVRLDKINTILKNNFPSDEEGQKYIVSYNVYNGADAVYSLAVIKEGTEYVKQ